MIFIHLKWFSSVDDVTARISNVHANTQFIFELIENAFGRLSRSQFRLNCLDANICIRNWHKSALDLYICTRAIWLYAHTVSALEMFVFRSQPHRLQPSR